MPLTVQDALFHTSHALGNAGDQSPVGGIPILNYAGEWLASSQSWSWLMRPQVQLDFVANQDYVWLPLDYQSLKAWDITSGLASSLAMTDHQTLVDMRTSSITTSTWRYWAAVTHAPREAAPTSTLVMNTIVVATDDIRFKDGYNPEVTITFSSTAGAETATSRQITLGASIAANMILLADEINNCPLLFFEAVVDSSSSDTINITHKRVGTRGVLTQGNWHTDTDNKFTATNLVGGVEPGTVWPRLDLWPTPTADSNNAITLYYVGGWRAVETDTAIIPLPEWMIPLYITTIRAVARGFEMEDETNGSMEDRLFLVKRSEQYEAASRTDSNLQTSFGPMTGGAVTGVSTARQPSHLDNFSLVPDQ